MTSEFEMNRCGPPNVCSQWSYLLTANQMDKANQWWWALVLVGLAIVLRVIALFILAAKSKI